MSDTPPQQQRGRQVLTGVKELVHFDPYNSDHMKLARFIVKQTLTSEEVKEKASFRFQFILDGGFTNIPAMLNHKIAQFAFEVHERGILKNVQLLPVIPVPKKASKTT